MRHLMITTAAALAVGLIAAPAYAAPAGYVGAQYIHQSVDPGNLDADGWRIDGAAAFDLAPIGVAINGGVTDSDQNNTDATWDVGAHAFGKLAGGKLGAFVDYADDGNGDNIWGFGGEGQFGAGPATLVGSVGWQNYDSGVFDDAWGVGAEARIFPTDNLRLSGSVGYSDLNGVVSLADEKVWTGRRWRRMEAGKPADQLRGRLRALRFRSVQHRRGHVPPRRALRVRRFAERS